ncbi:DUF1697 domain-containing protein [Sporosarcina sp. BP05]|uniref:DUF1697 domain-containing protein n=1 Tax=Sporosarcina sp. BP05 TaxID=2758726 RepID=UPI0016456F97|nr:DUF1697 domain-containing protein [Sporosarcina sp. BP05]
MTINIALLRGINVGGHNKIKMGELRQMFEILGFSRVQTYIQSGNVLFESHESEQSLIKRIEGEIEKVFGFSIKVVIRTTSELEWISNNCPFTEEAVAEAKATSDGESLYVSLLQDKPSQDGIDRIGAYKSDNDKFMIEGREVYLLFRLGVRNAKLANNLHRLDVPSTMRNWKTINRLTQLAKEMED